MISLNDCHWFVRVKQGYQNMWMVEGVVRQEDYKFSFFLDMPFGSKTEALASWSKYADVNKIKFTLRGESGGGFSLE